jgi:hypothetical protein
VPYRVVQWATGNLGRAAVEGILSHPELTLVGVWVHSDEKANRDAGDICGIGPIGITTTQRIEDVVALAPDCVLYSPLLPIVDEVVTLLSAGINVVTPLDWFYPDPARAEAVAKACSEGGSTLHGTGIHPGGMTELIPLVLSAFSREITHVKCEEFSDCRSYGAIDVLQHIMLFGKPEEEAKQSMMLNLLSGGFSQSIRMVADALGFRLDSEISTRHDIGLATANIDVPFGTIEPGQLAAQRFTWQGCVDGTPVVTAAVNWFMGTDDIEADWLDPANGEGYFIEIAGDPPVRVALAGVHPDGSATFEEVRRRNPGMVATAIHCVSAIPYVCNAEPGICSYLDLPLVAGRAARELAG